jgi:hypothetical protein
MDTEFTVALSAHDDAMEMPWSSASGEFRYYDLKRQPELLLNVQEAFENQEMGQFLAAINSAHSILETLKCDTWLTDKLEEDEQVYGGGWKFVSYVDIIFNSAERRLSLPAHEELAQALCKLLRRAPQISSAAEFALRHCYYHSDDENSRQGFGITFYLSGYGADEAEARSRWNIGMKLVENALLQLSATYRKEASSAALT